MESSLREGLQFFADTRQRTLGMTEALSQQQLDAIPAPGKWSIGEVLDHLLLTEEFYRGEMETLIGLARSGREPVLRRSFSDVDVSIGFIPKPLLSLFEIPIGLMAPFVPASLRELLLRNRVLPAQNPTFATPRHGRPAGALRSDLAASLAETQALFASNADLDCRCMVLTHPLMGSNDVPGMLRFLSLHEQRHQDQMREIQRGWGNPSA